MQKNEDIISVPDMHGCGMHGDFSRGIMQNIRRLDPDMRGGDFSDVLFHGCVFTNANLTSATFSISTGNKTFLYTLFPRSKNFDQANIFFEGKRIVGLTIDDQGRPTVADPSFRISNKDVREQNIISAAQVMEALGFDRCSVATNARPLTEKSVAPVTPSL